MAFNVAVTIEDIAAKEIMFSAVVGRIALADNF